MDHGTSVIVGTGYGLPLRNIDFKAMVLMFPTVEKRNLKWASQ